MKRWVFGPRNEGMMQQPTTLERHRTMLRTAMGPRIAAALADPRVEEIMVNPDGRLRLERVGEGRIETDDKLSAEEVERIIRLVASHVHVEVHAGNPELSAELPDTGERFQGFLPPVALAPCFTIRKPAAVVFDLDNYVAKHVMLPMQAETLRRAVLERRNILIAGSTFTGKTTLANALLKIVGDQDERVVLIEDTRELKCTAKDCVALRTQPGVVSLAALVRATLRMRPDRIIVGEVRDKDALDLLKAWNTGHPGGIATLHANSALAALYRLESLISEAVVNVPRYLIAETIDLVVFISGRGHERRIQSISEVNARLDAGGEYVLSELKTPHLRAI